MSKFLLIGSVAAMLYGDCAWGMEDIDPWRSTSSSGSDQFSAESSRSNAGSKVRGRRNSRQFNAEPTRENGKASYQDAQIQTEQSWSEHVRANPQQLQENRFIKDNGYRQYHYVPSNNSKIGRATPTEIISVSGDLRCWNDIAEIRYANDMSYDKLKNPKVILYRNKDNSCYIILRTDDGKKYGVFYGLNERNVEMGRQSFAVYEVSEDIGSFTDGVKRLIYVDESGLYFVPAAENSVENVINTYQKEGKFNFEGSVIKISAIDGTITWNGEPVTEDNFFNNWVLEGNKTVISDKQPGEKEVLRKFYLPEKRYNEIYEKNQKDSVNLLIKRRFQLIKANSKNGAEELVRDGTFSSVLPVFGNGGVYKSAVRLIRAKGGKVTNSINTLISSNSLLFKDPEFVRSLKPAFKELEKDYEHNKESKLWIPFEIVRNL